MSEGITRIGLTSYVADFIKKTSYEDIPAAVIETGKGHILDCLACGIAGTVNPASQIVRRYLREQGCAAGAASVIGAEDRIAPRFAAFLNGLAIHADDFDDTAPQPSNQRNGGMHATGSVFAAALALAEQKGLSGKDLMRALHIGVEISCKLNHAVAARHYEGGYHTTSTINIFGVTAAAACLLGLPVGATEAAFGLAASQSGGLRENFGTMTNPFHGGHSAESGLVAAELVERGFTAARGILEAPRGFFNATAGGYDADAIMGRLGAPWAFIDPGMWIKPYPCGALTHPGITALLALVRSEDLRPDHILRIRVRTNRRIANTLIHHRPTSGLQGKFSMEFCMAAAILRRRITLQEFSDEVVNSPEIRSLIDKVDYAAFDREEPDYTNVTTLLNVELTNGKSFSLRADYGKGSSRNPMSFDEIVEKFMGCAAYAGWPDDRAERIVSCVRELEAMDDLAPLTNDLRAQ